MLMLIKNPFTMKKLLFLACLLTVGFMSAQDLKPSYEIEGEMVKVTYHFEDGTIYKQGFFKDKKLTGTWTEFNKEGDVVAIAHYKKGKKVGTWFQWSKDGLRQINFENSKIASVNSWKENERVASNK